MEWTQQMLARYLGRVRLGQTEAVVFNGEMQDREKIQLLQTWFTQS